jgi:hypothetical protein
METYDFQSFPEAGGVLLLNLLHHVVRISKDRAKEMIDYLLERYPFVIVDMGSFTEQGNWHWRRIYDEHWKSDAEMWNFLFANAEWRFKLLRYPTQGHGHRTLWKLYRRSYALVDLQTVQSFRRPPAIWPDSKQLIPLAEVGGTRVADTVEFELAGSKQGDKFWIKKYRGRTRQIKAELEMQLAARAAQEVSVNPRLSNDLRIVRPVCTFGEDTLVFLFEPDIFSGSIVHFQDWPKFFTPEQCRAASMLGVRQAGLSFRSGLTRLKLLQASDFQACLGWDGLAILDFEPNSWLIRLRMDTGATQKPQERTLAVTPQILDETLARIDAALEGLSAEIRELRGLMSSTVDATSLANKGRERAFFYHAHRLLSRLRRIRAWSPQSRSPKTSTASAPSILS